ncbi:MAG: nodulation protein NfeD [Syntrophorhabdales bacterium]|jgi:membrane-bound serine protease (ClpP class)
MKRLLPFFLWLALMVLSAAPGYGARPEVYEIKVHGVIGPPAAQFISESIKNAGSAGAAALLILLDTPGGLDTSMREIVKAIMEAPLPVIVYVHPSGARAASAGTIILIAAQVAAMTPGTNVGAAHPVSIGGIGNEKMDKEMMAKVVQDAQAYARSLAAKRGRNAEWAAKAVRTSASITADEALKGRVIDVVAGSVDELLSLVNGRVVEVGAGRVTLATKGAKIVAVETPFKYTLLSYITDPNVAYLLMMIGFYGILFEIYSPGAVFPGVMGAICLILAFYAFQTVPISYAGLSLIILGIIFFVMELKVASYGLLSIAGAVSIMIGSIMLIDLPSSWLSLSWQSIAAVVAFSIIFFVGVLSYAVKAQFSKVKTGREGLIGEIGSARTDISPAGKAFVHGELWDALSDTPVLAGERVRVIALDGMVMKVKKASEAR